MIHNFKIRCISAYDWSNLFINQFKTKIHFHKQSDFCLNEAMVWFRLQLLVHKRLTYGCDLLVHYSPHLFSLLLVLRSYLAFYGQPGTSGMQKTSMAFSYVILLGFEYFEYSSLFLLFLHSFVKHKFFYVLCFMFYFNSTWQKFSGAKKSLSASHCTSPLIF